MIIPARGRQVLPRALVLMSTGRQPHSNFIDLGSVFRSLSAAGAKVVLSLKLRFTCTQR